MDADEVIDALETAMTEPLKASGDAGSVEMRKIDDIIKADQYAQARRAANRRFGGLKFTKLIPPGAS